MRYTFNILKSNYKLQVPDLMSMLQETEVYEVRSAWFMRSLSHQKKNITKANDFYSSIFDTCLCQVESRNATNTDTPVQKLRATRYDTHKGSAHISLPVQWKLKTWVHTEIEML